MDNCQVCNGESGGEYLGVAAIPGVPMSIGWCRNCIERNATPKYVVEHDYIFVADGDLDNLNQWARSRYVWHDGKYMKFDDYVKANISDEDVKKQVAELEKEIRDR